MYRIPCTYKKYENSGQNQNALFEFGEFGAKEANLILSQVPKPDGRSILKSFNRAHIQDIEPNSLADQKGLKMNDTIIDINGIECTNASLSQAADLITSRKGRCFRITEDNKSF